MNRRNFIKTASSFLAATRLRWLHGELGDAVRAKHWTEDFRYPPKPAYPWVYSFWVEGNITREGITADLESMAQAGISGLLFMDGALENPVGPHRFMSKSWLEMFRHMLAEAERLGIEVNLHNAPGWCGSGGPWVKPEQASQKVILSETILEGPSRFQALLTKPSDIHHDYYRDIAVLAFPIPACGEAPSYRIPDFNSTKSFAGDQDFFKVVPWPRFIATNAKWPEVAADQCVQSADMKDLSDKLDKDGKLVWDVPAGRWIVLRFGHTVSNGTTRSAQSEANGLECNKLDQSAVEAHFEAMVGKLAKLTAASRKVLVSTHIDSWEAGSGNWTAGFAEEFQRRRNYNLRPYLPTLAGIVVNSREISERFLWDFRETISELMLENYAEHFRTLANSRGMRLSIEGYDGTCDDLRYAGRADEPMSEFWRSCYSGLPLSDLNESMASAAHVYGKQIIGAEAFTSFRGDFLEHPATLKPLADWAFCTGINRLCFSEWIMQPWPNLVPGVSFQAFGTVFHRSETWWAQAKPWHDYIARCQYMLRQGQFVADVCFVVPEGAPYRFTPPIPASQRGGVADRPGYNFDGCPAELALNGMTVKDGKVLLPSGMEYRLLVLPTYNANDQPVMRLLEQADYAYKPSPMPRVETMTPQLLRRVKELVEAGATVLGNRPLKSPSLASFPACDDEVKSLADELWGENHGASGVGERRLGKGRVIWGLTPEQVLSRTTPPDFTCDPLLRGKLNYIHRRATDHSEIYFIVNQDAAAVEGTCSFRTTVGPPQLYWPETGHSQELSMFTTSESVTTIPISLRAHESVFVVFRQRAMPQQHIVDVTRDSKSLWPKTGVVKEPDIADDNPFVMAAWITPGPEIVLPKQTDGGWVYPQEMQTPAPGYQTFAAPGQGRGGFAVGKNGIVVFRYSESGTAEPLVAYAGTIAPSTLVGVVYQDRIPRIFINGKLAQTGTKNRSSQSGSSQWADRRPFAGEIAALAQFEEMLKAANDATIAPGSILASQPIDELPAYDFLRGEIWSSGAYTCKTAGGHRRSFTVQLPPPEEIEGPWQVAFDPKWGGPAQVTFETLEDWSRHSDAGIRYYSGAATYRKSFRFVQSPLLTRHSRIHLDLGRVAVIAEASLNGKNLGILWKAPYRMDVTDSIQAGENILELQIVNVWINRLIGDEYLPEDSERAENGQLKAWPQWVLDGKSSPTGRFTFTSYRLWTKHSPLVQSGLVGPVRLLVSEKV